MNKGWPIFMDRRVKERLVGATILVVLIVLIVPELLSGPKPVSAPAAAAGAPDEAVRNVTVDLATSRATSAEDLAASAASSSTAAGSTAPSGAVDPTGSQPAPSSVAPDHAGGPPTITTLKAQQPTQTRQPALENESPVPNGGVSTPSPGAPREAVGAEGSTRNWAVQIGSYASRANADKQMRRLKAHDASVYVSSSGKGPSLRYRVRVGPFADRGAAEKAMTKLRKEGQSASLVPP
ncbi:MAG: SPOR domain-containing protein [Steroidobacteraceae bacterium]|jgi:DedD protein